MSRIDRADRLAKNKTCEGVWLFRQFGIDLANHYLCVWLCPSREGEKIRKPCVLN